MKHFDGFGWLHYISGSDMAFESWAGGEWNVLTVLPDSKGRNYAIVEHDGFDGQLVEIFYTDFERMV